ncbi:hypothetical protein [Gracilinema caldarium]|uniref:Uncharacterized protein n=1 Tax=Gracilinema caldarium (strain ATCC 51460 / DSM 7334 / H1) TaxID=744872 RepID=F8EZ14_GRAC1|nr:hypothetical protein [Gracilinema caldarium]AEJ19245.1 hypothetical protein Spica_1098 [Gracilinema caldarium DSM 7334]
MGENNTMEQLLQEFRAGVSNQRDFEQRVIQYLLNNPHRFSLTTLHPEDRIDFIAFYFPRLRRSIEHYHDTGHSFDAYIHRSIQYALRDYKKEEQLNQDDEIQLWHQSKWSDNGETELVLDTEQPYMPPEISMKIRNPRQILLLALKSYRYISPDFSQRIAHALGIDPCKLEQWFHMLKLKRLKIDERINSLQTEIQVCYIKKLRYEGQLTITDLDPIVRIQLEVRAAKNVRRLEKLTERLHKIKKSASNQELAEVLQIPKGTVDATLFVLKQKYKNIQDLYN